MRLLLGVLLAALFVGMGCDSPAGAPLQQVVDQILGVSNTGGTSDMYEDNSSSYNATPIYPNTTAQSHTVYPIGDIDWFQFSATAGVTYVIETFGSTDTYLQLYASNGTSSLESNDDGGENRNAQITYTPSSSTTLYFKVNHFSNSVTGSYTVSVTSSGGGTATGDSYEPNGNSSAATAITPDAAAQSHTLYPLADHDWFVIDASAGVTYSIETFGSMDTYLDLYSSNGVSVISSDDEGGNSGSNAKITYTPSSSTMLYFRVKEYSDNATGSYTVLVTSSGGQQFSTWYAIREEYKGYTSSELLVKDSTVSLPSPPDFIIQMGETDLIEYSNESTCYDRFVVGYTVSGTDLILDMSTTITNPDKVQNFGYTLEGSDLVFSNKFEYFADTDWGDSTFIRTFVYRVVYQQTIAYFPPTGWPTSECTAVVSVPRATQIPAGLVKRLVPRP